MTLEEAKRAQVILSEAFEHAGIKNVGLGITKLEGEYAIHLAIQDGANLDAIYIGTPIAQGEDINA